MGSCEESLVVTTSLRWVKARIPAILVNLLNNPSDNQSKMKVIWFRVNQISIET